jgi:HEPN domain-containing protein
VNQWLAKSEEDLLVSGLILGAEMTSYDTAGFHAQQAAEKALKALLVRIRSTSPLTKSEAAR